MPVIDTRVSGEEFRELKDKLPFGQLPVLRVIQNGHEHHIAQSAAIMRYLGKLATPDLIYPSDAIQAALIDSIIDQENDLFMGLSVSRYRDRFGFGCLDETTVSNIRKDLNDNILPRHLNFFDNLLQQSKSGWIGNTEHPSIADFILVPRLQWLMSGEILLQCSTHTLELMHILL